MSISLGYFWCSIKEWLSKAANFSRVSTSASVVVLLLYQRKHPSIKANKAIQPLPITNNNAARPSAGCRGDSAHTGVAHNG